MKRVLACTTTFVLGSAMLIACTVTTTGGSGGATPDGGVIGSDGGKKDSSSNGNGGNDGSVTGDETLCGDICAKGASAGCAVEGCKSKCEEQSGKVPSSCKDEWESFLECAKDSNNLKCNSKGEATTTDCEGESTALLGCLTGGTLGDGGSHDSGPNPPTDASGTCGNLTTGNSSCDSCMHASCCSQEAACANHSQCIPFANCIADCASGDTACETQCENAHPGGAAALTGLDSCISQSCVSACQ